MACAACRKPFKVSERVLKASCGHIVHCYKFNCTCTSDFCTVCNQNFQVYAKEYSFVAAEESMNDQDLKAMEKPPKKTIEDQEQEDEENKTETMEAATQPTSPEIAGTQKPRLLDDEFIKRQFEVQRDIITHLIGKIKLQEKITVESNKIIKEQQDAFKKLTSAVMKLHSDIKEIQNQISDIVEELYEDDHCHSNCNHEHNQALEDKK